MDDQLRPEFVQAIDAALWNWWFWVAYAAPFVIIIPASARTWSGCLAAPVAFLACWLAHAHAIDVYDDAFARNAVTRREWDAVNRDTGRTFAPFLRGTPIAICLTGLAMALGTGARKVLLSRHKPASPAGVQQPDKKMASKEECEKP
jgi:hypothetical protein